MRNEATNGEDGEDAPMEESPNNVDTSGAEQGAEMVPMEDAEPPAAQDTHDGEVEADTTADAADTAADAADATADAADAADGEASVPAAELTDEQMQELIAKVEEVRKKRSNTQFTVFGWKVLWSWRQQADHGDMTVIDPASGGKIHSVIGLKRRLGLAAAAPGLPPPPRAALAAASSDPAMVRVPGEKRADMTEAQIEVRKPPPLAARARVRVSSTPS